jgi:uncharacterized protein
LKFPVFILLSVILVLVACSDQNKPVNYSAAQIDSLKKAFYQYRAEKDSSFKTAVWSPLLPGDKTGFKGLKYYDYDISFRHELRLLQYTKGDTIEVAGSKAGDLRKAVRCGYFEFEQSGKSQRLEVWEMIPQDTSGETHLFLGFWDVTSGNETYPGGRYLDIKKINEQKYLVDFNYAYNPYCAYSDRYSCLIPPMENRLTVALTCGEKIYKMH